MGNEKCENGEKNEKKIVLPADVQKRILKFFLKTSMPRLIRQERMNNSLSETEGHEMKC